MTRAIAQEKTTAEKQRGAEASVHQLISNAIAGENRELAVQELLAMFAELRQVPSKGKAPQCGSLMLTATLGFGMLRAIESKTRGCCGAKVAK